MDSEDDGDVRWGEPLDPLFLFLVYFCGPLFTSLVVPHRAVERRESQQFLSLDYLDLEGVVISKTSSGEEDQADPEPRCQDGEDEQSDCNDGRTREEDPVICEGALQESAVERLNPLATNSSDVCGSQSVAATPPATSPTEQAAEPGSPVCETASQAV